MVFKPYTSLHGFSKTTIKAMGMPAHGFLLFHLLIMIVFSAPVECLFIDDGHVVHDAFVIVRDGFEAARKVCEYFLN